MVTLVVGDLVRRIEEGVPPALADEHDAVHRLRTSVRRLRNVLAGFRGLLDPAATRAARDRLAALGGMLGAARDREVRVEQLRSAAREAGLDAEAATWVEPLVVEHTEAHAAFAAWWDGVEGEELRRTLAAWTAAPPLTDRAAVPAEEAAYRVVRRQATRTADAERMAVGRLEEAHELRKAGRRLRHLADAVTAPPVPVLGKRARRLGRAGQQIQSVLGDHRDALLLADHLRAVGADVRLLDVCHARAAAAERALPDALTELDLRLARFRRPWKSGHMDQRISFVTLAVADLDATRHFYLDGLGWRAELDVPGEVLMIKTGERLVLSLWDRDAFAAEVGEPMSSPGVPPLTLAHNVATPAEVDAVLETARAAGADPVSAGQQRDWGGYTGYFADPDGFRWEIAYNPESIGQEVLP